MLNIKKSKYLGLLGVLFLNSCGPVPEIPLRPPSHRYNDEDAGNDQDGGNNEDLEGLVNDASNFCSLKGKELQKKDYVKGSNLNASWIDVTDSLGIPEIYGLTASWGDINNDGYPDLLIGSNEGLNLFINCLDKFYNINLEYRINDFMEFFGLLWNIQSTYITDFDNDNDKDILIANGQNITLLSYKNKLNFEGYKLFEDTEFFGRTFSTISAVDINEDNLLDIYAARMGLNQSGGGPSDLAPDPNPDLTNIILLNKGNNSFIEYTNNLREILTPSQYHTYSFLFIPRIIFNKKSLFHIGNDQGPDVLFEYEQENFRRLMIPHLEPESTMGEDFRYRDNTGEVDIVLSDTGKHPLLSVDMNNNVIDISSTISWKRPYVSWGIVFGDFDNDGDEDLVYANGSIGGSSIRDNELLYLENDQELRQVDELNNYNDKGDTAGSFFDGTIKGDHYSVSTADFDRDGCMDLAVTSSITLRNDHDRIIVLKNKCNYPGNWVGLNLPDHIGSMIEVSSCGIKKYRTIKSISGVASRSDYNLHLGLGNCNSVDKMKIKWNDNTESVYEDLIINKYNDIKKNK